jgi:hypothetical protein
VSSCGASVSLSESSFEEVSEHWDDPERTWIGPHFGWLCTPIPEYPDTMLLKTSVRQRPPGERPLVELEPTDHRLSRHQREGIEPADLREIIQRLLHD